MTLVTYLVNGGLLLWLACGGLCADGRSRGRMLARAFAPLLLAFALAYGLDRALPWAPDMARPRLILRLLAAVALFGSIYGAAVSPLVRGLGLRQIVREFNLMMPRAPRRGEPAPDA
jgi:hypothetical protein